MSSSIMLPTCMEQYFFLWIWIGWLMKVNWNDLHRPESPGSLAFRGGTITIRQEEIDIWRTQPDALFRVRGFRLWTNEPEYSLASDYELPNEDRRAGWLR